MNDARNAERIREAKRRAVTARAMYEYAVADAVRAGEPVVDVARVAGLARTTVYAILDRRRGVPSGGFLELHHLDQGAVLLHAWARSCHGDDWARENRPCRFLRGGELTGLDGDRASRVAASYGTWESLSELLGADYARELRDLAAVETASRAGAGR